VESAAGVRISLEKRGNKKKVILPSGGDQQDLVEEVAKIRKRE